MATRLGFSCGGALEFGACVSALMSMVVSCSGQPPRDVCDTNGIGGGINANCATGGWPQVGGSLAVGGTSSLVSGGSSASLTAITSMGGRLATGGQSTTFNAVGAGGSSMGGGATTGGSTTGGVATGGRSSSAVTTVGGAATGGAATGGAATGGKSSSGGVATGGKSSSGGAATGGAATGGAATGGAATGGKSSSGGAATGGAATGGAATGGRSSSGGTTGSCGSPLPGVNGADPLNPKYFWIDESCYPLPKATAGFVDLAPVTYTYMNPSLQRVTSTASATRMFYSFIPALENPKDKPVFVFFNGGPAGSTTGLLFSFGTGPMTLHVDLSAQDSEPKPNPNNWATLGNLLYIDSRQAGFSYGLASDPSDAAQRQAGYNADNFNFFGDAADFVRVILRVLKAQPALQNNPVVLVAESYGGMRGALLLNMILDPVAVGDSSQTYFVDASLAQELQDHFAAVFRNESNAPLSRARIARQFGWQVLVQPAFDFSDQYAIQRATQCDPSYLSTQRLTALGLNCPLPYDEQSQAAAGIMTNARISATSSAALMTPASFAQLLAGVDPKSIPGLSSSTRTGAYRLTVDDTMYPYAPSSWTSTQGTVPTYDRYYIDQNYLAYDYYQITSSLTRVIGWEFLHNLLNVHTFITRAALDFVIIPEVIPISFMMVDSVTPVVSDVSIVESQPPDTARPGSMVFTYRDVPAFGVTAGTQRTVRFPTYLQSAHPVTVYQPAEFYADVSEFLSAVLPPEPEPTSG